MRTVKKLDVVGLVLAVVGFAGTSSASAAQWLDNGTAIGTAENVSIVDDGHGVTFGHSGGLGGARSITCHVSASGTVVAAGGTVGSVTLTNCVDVSNCPTPSATVLHLPWTTNLVSATEDDITAGTGGNPGWSATCSGLSLGCMKATTPVNVSNDSSVSPARVDGVLTAANTSAACADGGTGTVTGTVWRTLVNGHNLSVGP